jgi:hypothetical protein
MKKILPSTVFDAVAAKVETLPPVERPQSASAIVRAMAPQIAAALERGQDPTVIQQILRDAGVNLQPKTIIKCARSNKRASPDGATDKARFSQPRADRGIGSSKADGAQPTPVTGAPRTSVSKQEAAPAAASARGSFPVIPDTKNI